MSENMPYIPINICICPKQYARLELVGPKLQITESKGNKKVYFPITSDLCLCGTLYISDLACNHMKIDEKMINYNNISPKKMSNLITERGKCRNTCNIYVYTFKKLNLEVHGNIGSKEAM